MKHTFLHISDLHFRPDWPEQTGFVYTQFIEDLAQQLKLYESPYLVFSGDLVNAAAEEGHYEAFMKEIVMPLDQLGITKDRRIVVPGNHDVSRNALKGKIRITLGGLSALTDEESFLRELPALTSSVFDGKFTNYINIESEFARFTCCGTSIGGAGWELPGGLGIYCLNTALCSFAGLEDPEKGDRISDKSLLSIDTRSLYQWEQQSPSEHRVLVMHHPLEWLSEWAREELESVISERFSLILYGHVHKGISTFHSQGRQGSVFSIAPPLFTRKADPLGYSFASIDTTAGSIQISYRQWAGRKFVLGSGLAADDTGNKLFPMMLDALTVKEVLRAIPASTDTETLLESEFIESSTCCSSKRQIWVERDLSRFAETTNNLEQDDIVPPTSLVDNPRSSVIRAPRGFGLTALGRHLSLAHYRHHTKSKVLIVCDTPAIEAHRQGVIQYVKQRCQLLQIDLPAVSGIILDSWNNDHKANKTLRLLRAEFPGIPIIVLQGFDDFYDIGNASVLTNAEGFETLYLRSLKRARIREIVHTYLEEAHSSLDEDLVANKLIEDIDALNMHRTPMNCLLLLKLIERSFDDSPVNRTQMIGNVLFSLFHEFDKIPKYSTRPDLKDCEFALGYLCDWMIRSGKRSFTKNDFFQKVGGYCSQRMIELDIEVLFNFLCTENILIRRGIEYGFRLAYWLFYFTAHRMHHDKAFADFIFAESRYTAFPEVIEFYTGIDRMRTDAVNRLTEDLDRMDAEFLMRTRISPDANPFAHALWEPDTAALQRMRKEVVDSIQESALPSEVKDAVADGSYDRSKPYHQEIAQFITKSSLDQMIRAMKAAARALRNSDHVEPEAKARLLNAVLKCWERMCQILVLLSPVLATNRQAQFDGMGFHLARDFDDITEPRQVWETVMTAIVDNVVLWYQKDLFSKKLGPLFKNSITSNVGELGELLVLLILVRQRPPGWNKTIEEYVVRANKNSFYLNKVYSTLRHEFKLGFANEHTRQQIRTLAAMAVAKHGTGAKHPNQKLIARAAKFFDDSVAAEESGSKQPEQDTRDGATDVD